MSEFLEEYGIEPLYAPAYHPASNGDIEIVHRQFRKIIPQIIHNSNIPVTR